VTKLELDSIGKKSRAAPSRLSGGLSTKYLTRKEVRERQERDKLEEIEKFKKAAARIEAEERRIKAEKIHMSQQILRDIRVMKYASHGL
jgi:hypothetical protein